MTQADESAPTGADLIPDPNPQERIAYKLLRLRSKGDLGPLFINARQVIPLGKWLPAEAHRTKGYAYRPGWHCSWAPRAPHLSQKGRVWAEVRIKDYAELPRPDHQGGMWLIGGAMRVERLLTDMEIEEILACGQQWN